MGCMCTLIRMRAYGYCDLHSWPGWRKHEKAKPELKWVTGAGEMAQRLRALIIFSKVPSSISSTHMVANIYNEI